MACLVSAHERKQYKYDHSAGGVVNTNRYMSVQLRLSSVLAVPETRRNSHSMILVDCFSHRSFMFLP